MVARRHREEHTMLKPLRVPVSLVVYVDPEAWEIEYGEAFDTRDALTENVAQYVFNQIQGHRHTEQGNWTEVLRNPRRLQPKTPAQLAADDNWRTRRSGKPMRVPVSL